MEDTLIKHPDFALAGRKELLKNDVEYDVILVDAIESPIEWPRKTKEILFREKESVHHKDTSYCG
ncbi:MAG: hypothetical protein ACOVOR_03995 [Rhabdochlamydiaceae bacterium]